MSDMFKSVEKYVKTVSETASANADSLLNQAKSLAPPSMPSMPTLPTLPTLPPLPALPPLNNLVPQLCCAGCGTSVPFMENLISSSKCKICGEDFCSKCLTKTSFSVPNTLLHRSFRSEAIEGKPIPSDEKQTVCVSHCFPLAMKAAMDKFSKEVHENFGPNFDRYLAHEFSRMDLFDIPAVTPEDSSFRQALRLVQIAEVVADFANIKVFKAAKYAAMGTAMIGMLIAADLMPVLVPLMESLKRHGFTGPTALINLYYLGCRHTMLAQQRRIPRSLDYQSDRDGVLLQSCPLPVLTYVSQYISPSQWLYISRLPPPHEGNDWSAWYLSKMILRQGWTLLMCVNDTTKLSNGAKCPAFALVARCFIGKEEGKSSSSRPCREAMLLIRGSSCAMDWSINIEETMASYTYSYYAASSGELQSVTDCLHYGIYKGAMGILDAYNVRSYLNRLLDRGYEIKIVGHSLGAGVAALIAADMRSSRITSSPPEPAQPTKEDVDTFLLPDDHVANLKNPRELVKHISAVIFSCPAFLGPPLADAFLEDRLLINVVNGSDPIPRFCLRTLALLAEEMRAGAEQAQLYMTEDMQDAQDYLSKMGKAADIHAGSLESQAERKERIRLVFERKKLQKEEAIRNSTSGSGKNGILGTSIESMTTFFKKTNSKKLEGDISNDNVELAAIAVTAASTEVVAESDGSTVSDQKIGIENTEESLEDIWRETVEELQKQTEKEDDDDAFKNDRISQDSVIIQTDPENKDILTVTPGPIIHLYRELNATVRAAVVTYKHALFQRVELLPTQIDTDHDMKTYRAMVDGARFIAQTSANDAGKNEVIETAENWEALFPCALQRRVQKVDPHSSVRREGLNLVFPQSSIENTATLLNTTAPSPTITPAAKPAPNKPTRIQRNDSTSSFYTTLSGTDDVDNNGLDEDYLPCSICGLEVTWPFMLHSAASRALVTNRCASCGNVVCTVCAPAGDNLPGDGLGSKFQVLDLRLALPQYGIFTPARVCLHCYSDSSYPGLSMNYLESLVIPGTPDMS